MLLEEFNQVLMPYRDRMFGFARSFMSTREDAEDVVQDVYLKLWKNRNQLENVRQFEAYAMQAVRNTALNRLAKQRVRWEDLNSSEEEALKITPEHLVELSETKNLIRILIDQLPAKQRSIFKLREVEHYEVDQIASLLETDINNVRVNLSLARKRLKAAYYKVTNHEQRKEG